MSRAQHHGDQHSRAQQELQWLQYKYGSRTGKVIQKQSEIESQKQRGESIAMRRHEAITSSGQQVLWRYKRQVKPNGKATAQLSRLRGSTLTFQHNVGVSRVQRHEVTMHLRGAAFDGRHDLVVPWEEPITGSAAKT